MMENKKCLKGIKVFIEDKITREQNEVNKILIPRMKIEEENGKRAVVKRGKLI